MFYLFYCCIGACHLAWYLNKGNKMFIHRFTSIMFLMINALFFTVYLIFAEKFILDSVVINNQQIIKPILIYIVLIMLLYSR
jgi:hypothetical protein